MKDAFAVWILAVVIASGVVFSLTTRKSLSPGQPSDVTTSPANQSTSSRNPVKKKAVTVASTVAEPVAEVPEPSGNIPETKSAPTARPARQIPSIESFDAKKLGDIMPGMSASNVVDVLGIPALSAITVNRGGVQETYVYSKKLRDDRFAVIRLEDGRVTSMSQ